MTNDCPPHIGIIKPNQFLTHFILNSCSRRSHIKALKKSYKYISRINRGYCYVEAKFVNYQEKEVIITIMLRFLKVFLVIVTVSEGCRSVAVKENEPQREGSIPSLPVPNPKYLRIEDPAHVTVSWDPVKVGEDNPILGFKVSIQKY